MIWLGNFWCFGKLVAEERWSLMRGGRSRRFDCTTKSGRSRQKWWSLFTRIWDHSTSYAETHWIQVKSQIIQGNVTRYLKQGYKTASSNLVCVEWCDVHKEWYIQIYKVLIIPMGTNTKQHSSTTRRNTLQRRLGVVQSFNFTCAEHNTNLGRPK